LTVYAASEVLAHPVGRARAVDGIDSLVSNEVGIGIRVLAMDAIQHESPLRPGQDHGVPALVRSLLAAQTLDFIWDHVQ
jgi:hypothetical protein